MSNDIAVKLGRIHKLVSLMTEIDMIRATRIKDISLKMRLINQRVISGYALAGAFDADQTRFNEIILGKLT